MPGWLKSIYVTIHPRSGTEVPETVLPHGCELRAFVPIGGGRRRNLAIVGPAVNAEWLAQVSANLTGVALRVS